MKYILASGSPRRREILNGLNFDFRIIVPDADETSDTEDPALLTEELARRKAEAVREYAADGETVIACDTVVYLDGKILGKPKDRKTAYGMLKSLSGRTHKVVSGLCVISGDKIITDHAETLVTFSEMSEEDIENCIDNGEPYDKAGGYAVQGVSSLYIEKIVGEYFNVVGLPVCLLNKILKEKV